MAVPPVHAPVDAQMVTLMRCLLFAVALVAAYFDSIPVSWPLALHLSIIAYGCYSVVLFASSLREQFAFRRAQPWIDVAFYASLVALSHGTGSVFFHFFFFAIVAASFSRGFREGVAVTMFAVLSFVATGLAAYALGAQFDVGQALTRSVSLFILGYMISYWGDNELASRQRLNLLRDLSGASNPRAGIESLMAEQMGRLVKFFNAESCLVVLPKDGGEACALYRTQRSRLFATTPADEISKELGQRLLGLPPLARVSFDCRPQWWRAYPRFFLAWGPDKKRCAKVSAEDCGALANFLETASFASVPYRPTDGLQGRLYLTSQARRFAEEETEYLAQVATQMGAAVNNALLTEELMQNAAQEERSKISRDIHDTTVQSYIGLKLGLEALYRDLGRDSNAAARIKELLDMANFTVDDLRRYVDRLRGRYAGKAKNDLLTQIEEQRRRYRDLHGITVELRGEKPIEMDSQLGAQAYQVVCEALSNIFRHTAAKQAFVDLRCQGNTLAIEVGNASPKNGSTAPFMPRSITERAISLGGKVQVKLNNDGHDVVQVTLPLGARTSAQQRGAFAD